MVHGHGGTAYAQAGLGEVVNLDRVPTSSGVDASAFLPANPARRGKRGGRSTRGGEEGKLAMSKPREPSGAPAVVDAEENTDSPTSCSG